MDIISIVLLILMLQETQLFLYSLKTILKSVIK